MKNNHNIDRIYDRKILDKLKQEINEITKEIEISKKKNKKNFKIRNLKISLRLMQFVTPFVLISGISFFGFKAINFTPFHLDDVKAYSNVMKEIDQDSNITTYKSYEDFNDQYNKLYLYCAWHKNEDDSYSRNIKVYDLNEESIEYILELLEEDPLNINNILDNPKKILTESTIQIDEYISDNKPSLKAIIYSEDKNDFIIIKEAFESERASDIIYIIINFIFYSIWLLNSKFKDHIQKIKTEYKCINTKTLTKKLKIRKSNYDKLIGR